MADMHLACGAANGNARQAARQYQESFPSCYIPGHIMFSNLHQRIRDNGRFEINMEKLQSFLGRSTLRASRKCTINCTKKNVVPARRGFSTLS